ncbi:MAG: hypothetical protein HUK22_00475, partial [Thermoguttaceae bacterium]|nr:hypothetical protein [Thermoguttaceae bacterium]
MSQRKGPKNPGERNRDRDSSEKRRRRRRRQDARFNGGADANSNADCDSEEEFGDAWDEDFDQDEFDDYYDGGAYSTERFDASTQGDQTARTTSVANERAILVGVYPPGRGQEDNPLAELAGLAEAANVEPVGRLIQRRSLPDVAYCLGRGKLDELEGLVQAADAQVVLF